MAWLRPSRPRLPLVLQSESSECALACLAMVAGYHGHHVDLAELRRRFSPSSRGVDLASLAEMAGQLHLAARALRLEPEEAGELALPCILHWGMNHFVVLKRVASRRVEVHDPAAGARRLTHAELGRYFTGVALELVPTADFRPAAAGRRLRLRDFWSGLSGFKRATLVVLALSVLMQVFALLAPLYLQITVDEVVLNGSREMLAGLAFGFGVLLLIQTATGVLREHVILHLQHALNMQMGANLFRHLVRLPLDWFIRRQVGDVVSRFGSLEQVRRLLTTGVVTALVDGAMASLTLAAMAYYDRRLAAIVVGAAALYAALRWMLFAPFRSLTEEGILARARESSHFLESVRAIQTIKLFQKENDRLAQWQNHLAESLDREMRIARWFVDYGTLSALLFGAENLLVVYFAANAVAAGSMSLGMLYAFMSFKLRFVASMDALAGQWLDLRMLDVHLERLRDVVATPAETLPAPATAAADAAGAFATLEAVGLGFRYSEHDPFVFRHLSFRVGRGESVAVTGPSGCGKTTLLKCLLGLLAPTEGRILVDGRDIREVPGYRARIAAVMQEDQLLTGSLADNIACFAGTTDLDRVRRCARLACVDRDVAAMPMSFETLVGDLGTTLSGGQKQRILLARALYREPRILFLDEATSHLDLATERLVSRNVAGLDVMRILVAHRPETVRTAGRCIELTVPGADVTALDEPPPTRRRRSGDPVRVPPPS